MSLIIRLGILASFCLPVASAGLPEQFIVHRKDRNASLDESHSPSMRAARRDRSKRTELRRLRQGERREQVMDQLAHEEDVVHVEVDIPMRHFGLPSPNDGRFSEQWNLKQGTGGAHFQEAWSVTKGSSSQIIAVLDTGILPHPDLVPKLVPGYDMISDPRIANDGTNGRDNDPTDPGDWIGPGDACYQGWFHNSSWHGTHVAGIAAAQTNNGQGISGGDWNARILPVRVLGKCGGYSSDIADGIRWAAGGNVSGVPTNPNPATVINLSLGGIGSCGQYMQSAIDFALSRGAVVVVAAGNDSLNMDFTNVTPANCEGVITVGASSANGTRAGYSNTGERVDLMAPGGDFNGTILSTHNTGHTTASSHSYRGMNGTSMAAPHVAAAAALVLSVKSNFPPLQVRDILKRSTKSHISWSDCHEGNCGTGLLDAYEAVRRAQSTTPDSRFGVIAPINSSPHRDNTRMSAQDSGGGCGMIDLGSSSGGPKGPGSGPLVAMMMLMILMGLQAVKKEARRTPLKTKF